MKLASLPTDDDESGGPNKLYDSFRLIKTTLSRAFLPRIFTPTAYGVVTDCSRRAHLCAARLLHNFLHGHAAGGEKDFSACHRYVIWLDDNASYSHDVGHGEYATRAAARVAGSPDGRWPPASS